VWRADLAAAGNGLPDLLAPVEVARARRIMGERAAERWARSRAVLRLLLGSYLEQDPRAVELAVDPGGKPRLASTGAAVSPPSDPRMGLRFSVSHSAQLALYAFSSAGAVGIDVEVLSGRRRPLSALAARAFSEADARRVAAAAPGEREREFLAHWTRREAVQKWAAPQLGGGVESSYGAPWTIELAVGPLARATLAADGKPHLLSCWSWAP
jgi:4'-phosphopantetheinyl transferase